MSVKSKYGDCPFTPTPGITKLDAWSLDSKSTDVRWGGVSTSPFENLFNSYDLGFSMHVLKRCRQCGTMRRALDLKPL